MSASWVIGFSVGAVVVLLVVVLLLLMIVNAARAAAKAEAILAALEEARDNTEGLWLVDETNRAVERINDAATAARLHLESKGAGR